MTEPIKIRGLKQNNLKNISLDIPKNKIVVFTGVSGSGKSSIVFDTIAAESQRQMNETYTAWVRGRLPKYEKPNVEWVDNLNPSVIIDQTRLGGNARSTVGTISDMYSLLRLLFSRIGIPSVGPASYFSFNNPNGMCQTCAGIGKIMDFDINNLINTDNSYDEGIFNLPAFGVGNYYWKVYRRPEYFRTDVPWKDLLEEEQNILLYGSRRKGGERLDKKLEGVYNQFKRLVLMKGAEEQTDYTLKKIAQFLYERECPDCKGKRLNRATLSCKINGFNINDMCEMEFSELREELDKINDERATTIVRQLKASLDRMIDIGLPYLFMNRESSTLSGGERQRVKLAQNIKKKGNIYILDEPTTGLHPADIEKVVGILEGFVERGNTVIVIEHNTDVMKLADYIIDIGPDGGTKGGEVVFTGTPKEMIENGSTITAKYLRK